MNIWSFIPNNYVNIAKRTAMCYVGLREFYSDRIKDESAALLGAVLIDSIWYWASNNPRIPLRVFLDKFDYVTDQTMLRAVVTDLEILLMRSDSPKMDPNLVRRVVLAKVPLIDKTIDSVLENRRIKRSVQNQIDMFMMEQQFAEVRHRIGIVD